MREERERVVMDIFAGALRRSDAAERASYLAQACGDNAQLREQVEDLLQAHQRVVDALDGTAPAQLGKTIGVLPQITERPGDQVGRYELREKIGEGGCGVVYSADQEQPVRRRVALKIIKLGMDTRAVVGRFEAERQALALMDHPNIAKVFDAGSTETGRPYFVMELVRGIKCTDYCDQNKLATRERLELFIQVCQAVQHAHQKGIIHRDLKPSNILVTLHDGVPVPKIIDFGIAKATEGRLTDLTVYTELRQFIGTPAYMSPEQAEMSGLDIDTRSDIYSLGVLLYELLIGRTPFDFKELLSSGLDEMRRTIREKDPLRPSTRLRALSGNELTSTAERRAVDAPKLINLVSGDLDWIVMKCLEKDRTRRYETSNGLGMDVRRYLSDEPVLARPPSELYRFQKLVRRHKLVFAAAAAVILSLAVGLGLSGWFLHREKTQRRIAEGERNRAAAAQHKAEAAERLAATRADQLREALNLWHSGVTNLSQTEAFFRQTLQVQRKSSGDDSLDLVPTLQDLASILEMESKPADATTTLREALKLQSKALGEDNPAVVASLGNLGLFLERQGNFKEAESTFRQALAQERRQAATKPSDVSHVFGVVLHHLAEVLRQEKSLTEARELAQEAVDLYDGHTEWPPGERAHARRVLVDVVADAGNASEAKRLTERLRQTRDLTIKGMTHARSGELEAAASELTQVVELDPSDHWNFFVLVPILIQNGDVPGCQKQCRTMLNLFGNSQAPTIAERVAKTCLLLPSAVAGDDLARVCKLAEFAVQTGSKSQWVHWFEMTRALAEYRQGHFTNAVQWAERVQGHIHQARDDAREICEADSYMLLAMAKHRLQEPQSAQAALARGEELVQTRIAKLDSGDLGVDWHDVLTVNILLREAQGLIKGSRTAREKEAN